MKDEIRLRRKTVHFNQYQTCKIGGSICSGRSYQRADKPQSAFHHGQKCGYFPVVLHDSTGQELVNDRQQSLHVLGKGRWSQTDWRGLSGRTALRVNINISQRVHRHLNTMWSGGDGGGLPVSLGCWVAASLKVNCMSVNCSRTSSRSYPSTRDEMPVSESFWQLFFNSDAKSCPAGNSWEKILLG